MSRNSSKTTTHMLYMGWLVIDPDGGMKLTRDEPSTKPNERKIALKVKVPLSIFKTPVLGIDLTFDGETTELNKVEVVQAVQKAVKGMGLEVHFPSEVSVANETNPPANDSGVKFGSPKGAARTTAG